jgi:hypothetical protein
MFMIQEIGVAPVPGDGFYQEGAFGDECVDSHCRASQSVLAMTTPDLYPCAFLIAWMGQIHAFYLRA